MTRRPVSTPVRALAAFSYLLPVAIVLLALPAYRQIRLIRLHAISSAILAVGTGLAVLVFGSLRPAGLGLALLVGLVLSGALLTYFGAITWGAVWAYQGRPPPVPGVARLAERIGDRLVPPSPESPTIET